MPNPPRAQRTGWLRRIFGGAADGKLGTFAGVFTPSALTILGVIMYLRLGWVVGHVGLLGALVIVLIAHAITVVTGLSISAIATNRTVGTGGAYFMLSRSLGAQVGGAIGVPLFLPRRSPSPYTSWDSPRPSYPWCLPLPRGSWPPWSAWL